MRLHHLRVALLLGLFACSTSGRGDPAGFGNRCGVASHETITVAEPAEPPMQLRIESCRVDADACMDLCTTALAQHNVFGVAQTCQVTFDSGHTYIAADLASGCVANGGVL